MTTPRTERIGAAFAAAHDYERHARVQARVARTLAAHIAALPLPAAPDLLELGCGTGNLTAALGEAGIAGNWLVTDLAPAMVERARARLGESPARRFAALDGEHGPAPAAAPFDLVCSSLAFQWSTDPASAAAFQQGLVRPGGWLALVTLGEATFAEWRAAHAAHGLTPNTVPLPTAAEIAALFPGAGIHVETELEHHASARDFLHAVKAIGAATPAPGRRPLGAGALRRVMRTFEAEGPVARYEVVTVLWRKDG